MVSAAAVTMESIASNLDCEFTRRRMVVKLIIDIAAMH
jgi:hypothetical protein